MIKNISSWDAGVFKFLIILLFFVACGEPERIDKEQFLEQNQSVNQQQGVDGKADLDDVDLQSTSQKPALQALYITHYGNPWHDYEAQQKALVAGISRSINLEIDVVGKDAQDALALMTVEDYGLAYDVVIYNMCFADDFDLERINRIISQTRDFGVPAVLLHCSMHSFQATSPNYPEHQLELAAAEWDWREDNPNTEFPYWWKYTGVDTLSHDWLRALKVDKVDNPHPITNQLPTSIEFSADELYQVMQMADGINPLYTAYSPQSKKEHVVAWTHQVGNGEVFATTLGHNHHTIETDFYHQLIANGIAYLTGHLEPDGKIEEGFSGNQPTKNYQSTVTCLPSQVITARTVDQVQNVIRDAYDRNISVKMISVPQSNSNTSFVCPENGGVLLNLSSMNQVISLDQENMIVRVQPGIKATDLSKFLHEYGFAIPNMPDYSGVSIAGGIGTSAHHSSLVTAASMSDMVESMLIIDGMGNRRSFVGEEVQAAATHLGMLGVVVELSLKIEPQFKLKYGFAKGDDSALVNIEAMVREHDYARVMWFAGNQRYVIDYYDRVDVEEPGQSRHNLWSSTGSVFRFIGDLPYRVLNRAPLRAQCDSALLRYKFWSSPLKVIKSRRSAPVGWSHEMLSSSCDEGKCPWDNDAVRSRTMEAAFPLRQLQSWMNDVRAILDKKRACFPILGIYLRFSKGSDRWLSFNYGEDVVAFEIHVPKVAAETYHERSADVYDEIMQMSLAKYNARPHWGKNSDPSFSYIGETQYPRWSDFVTLKQEMDPKGLFENQIWKQMTEAKEPQSYPGCALSRSCICTKDSDCGHHYICDSGKSYAPARVCREK